MPPLGPPPRADAVALVTDVASELLLDELEADGHAELLGPLGVGTEAAISTSVTRDRCPVLAQFRRAITAPPLAEQVHVISGARYLVDDGDAR